MKIGVSKATDAQMVMIMRSRISRRFAVRRVIGSYLEITFCSGVRKIAYTTSCCSVKDSKEVIVACVIVIKDSPSKHISKFPRQLDASLVEVVPLGNF